MQRVHILVYGQVQGVFFRHQTKEIANKLGILGWVKNTDDGKVEIVAEGEKEKLQELITWCQKGPPFAKVEKVEVEWTKNVERFDGFEIIY